MCFDEQTQKTNDYCIVLRFVKITQVLDFGCWVNPLRENKANRTNFIVFIIKKQTVPLNLY